MTEREYSLEQALANLPLLEPPVSVWKAIENSLDRQERKSRHRRYFQWAGYGVAASVLAAMLGYVFMPHPHQANTNLQSTIDSAIRTTLPEGRRPDLRRLEGENIIPDALLVSAPDRRAGLTVPETKEEQTKTTQEGINPHTETNEF